MLIVVSSIVALTIRRDSKDLFTGRKILEDHPDFCREWMNRYPVLFLTLKDVEGRSFDVAYSMLKAVISDLCKKIDFLVDFLAEEEKVNSFDSMER